MAYIRPQSALKDLNSGDYFYPLTTLDQIIAGNQKLSNYVSESNDKLALSNISNITMSGNLSAGGSISGTSGNFTDDVTISKSNAALHIRNTATGNTYSIIRFGVSDNNNAAYIFLNSKERTDDGGPSLMTIRNNIGDVRIDDTLYLPGAVYSASWISKQNGNYDIGGFRFLSTGGYTYTTSTNTYTSLNSGTSEWGLFYYHCPRIHRTYTATDLVTLSSTIYEGGYFSFRARSFNSSNGSLLNYWDIFQLPPVAKDKTGNNSYLIITTKNLADADSRFVTLGTNQTISGQKTFSARTFHGEWIQFNSNHGLYFPNSGSGTHFYPANDVYYGGFQMQGGKNGYRGITMGSSDNDITIMSNGTNEGLYNKSQGRWAIHYNRTQNCVSINGGTTDTNYPTYINTSARIGGNGYVNNNLYVGAALSGSVWVGTNGDADHGEHQVGTQSGSGRLYIYAQAGTAANRGLYGSNKAGTNASYLSIQQDNYLRAGVRLYGAVWNDYAEFRKGQMDNLKPGQVVAEVGDGRLILSTARLQSGCKILSDTYGFAIGETEDYKLPIAVSGRVLVYCDTPKEELKPGDALCSNYNGNAIKMTRDEIIQYPERIIGTVSEIPNYEIWHGGDQNDPNGMKEDVQVNGRIWAYVR